MSAPATRKPISIHFHPFEFEKGNHAIEKEKDGVKRRYLKGIATGIRQDADGERLTKRCIQSLQNQAKSGDVLLTADLHGKGRTEDVGILDDYEIMPNFDWLITARVFDKHDSIGKNKLEHCDDLWKQVTGQSPYSKPKQRGFSIEGYLTELLEIDSDTGGRIIDNMELDFVTVVDRPSYEDSVAHSIEKALGSMTKWQIKKGIFVKTTIEKGEASYNNERYDLDTALDEVTEKIMMGESQERPRELKTAMGEYGDALINLLLKHEDTFTSHDLTEVKRNGEDLALAKIARSAMKQPLAVRKKLAETLRTLTQSQTS